MSLDDTLARQLLDEIQQLREELDTLRADLAARQYQDSCKPATYTLEEARKLLNCGRSSIYTKIYNGDLKRVPNIRKVLITRQSVERLLTAA